MATYYVRISGNDSNTGLSPAQAWRTIGKALGSSGISSGDTVFIGAGTYRETVTVGMTSATSETKVIGDTLGTYTGDAGEVIWSAYTAGDLVSPSTNTTCNLSGRDYLTFANIAFIGGSASPSCIISTAGTPRNISFLNCTFFGSSTSFGWLMYITSSFAESLNWTINGCRFWGRGGIGLNPASSLSGSHFNLNVSIQNSIFWTFQIGIGIEIQSPYTINGNGITIISCLFLGQQTASIYNSYSALNATYPTTVQNSVAIGVNVAMSSNASGSFVDGGGNRFQTFGNVVSGVSVHATTRGGFWPNLFPLELGQSVALGLPYRHPLMPYAASGTYPGGSLGFGNVSGGTSTDILGAARPSGTAIYYDSGTATSATASTLVDTTKNFPSAYLVGWKIRIVSGTGAGQIKTIRTNDATSVSISGGAPAGGQWAVTPDATSGYVIYQGSQVETGKATGGSTSTLIDSNANWATNQWSGYSCAFDNQVATVSSNTATTLTFTATVTAPTSSSQYSLYFPGSSVTSTNPSAGAFEGSNTGRIDTSTYAP